MNEQDNLRGDSGEKRQFGNYDLVRRIDMGGMGEVYLAHQRTAFDREVAVKIIRGDLSGDPIARSRFFREADVSAHLKHDHILPLFEFGEADGRLFLVTPYISGGTLAQRLLAGPLPVAEAQLLFSALVQAVAYIHRRGIVHRDLKPGNILLDNDEDSEQVYVRLIDFGIATKQGAEATPPLTSAGHEIGTLAYMAPERLNGIAASSNDIYSLGVILYQMLTGRLPGGERFNADSLPAPLKTVVLGCLATNPGDRYTSATVVLRAFEQACQTLDIPATSTARPTIVLPLPSASPAADAESTIKVHTLRNSGNLPASWKDGAFSEADYIAPTTDIAYARMGLSAGVDPRSSRRQQHTSTAHDGTIPGSERLSRAGQRRRKPLLLAVSLMIIVVLCTMAGVVYLALPLAASASVNIGPQVHALQQVYTVTALPSQTSIDVATTTVPMHEQVESLTGTQTGQTSGRFCDQLFLARCRGVVTPAEVDRLASQLRQSLASQLSTALDSKLQALHGTEIGTKQFTDLAESSNPDIGSVSNTFTVTLTEQGSVGYISSSDVQQLARQLLAEQSGPNTTLINSTVQIGLPVVVGVSDLGTVTMKIAAAGVAEYQWPASQLQDMLSHIKGMTVTDAQAYLREQAGVNVNSISISIHSILSIGNTLPYNTSQITVTFTNPTSLPVSSLPTLPASTVTPDNQTPDL